MLKVCIVHDSIKGNGKKLAEKLETEFKVLGADVRVGHRSEIPPETVTSNLPDLLIVGTAVRKFLLSPPTKRWISGLERELDSKNVQIPYVAVFLTHAMPDAMVRGRVERLQKRLSGVGQIGEVKSEWLSGQVQNIPGPFVDGVLEKAIQFADELFEWAKPDA